MVNFGALRSRFPTLSYKVYLSSGSYGLLSTDVEQAYHAYLADRVKYGAEWDGWLGRYEAVRKSIADLISSSADEIALTASVSAGINAIASALNFADGRDKIVLSNFEFPTSAQIWHAQSLRGARIEHVKEGQDGYIPAEHFEELIDERTKIVSISHVCYRNGAKLEVEKIVEIARRYGALVILDCYQSVGTEEVDVKKLGVDIAVGGMMKYLIGSAGLGFLYVREGLIRELSPTASGWYAQADFGAMDIFANTPSTTAKRFEAGTPAVPVLYAAEAGLNIIQEVGPAAIGSYLCDLTGRCIDRLSSAGWQIATPRDDHRRGPMVAIRSKDANRLVAQLTERSIVTSCRDGNVRAGFHFYNNNDDVDRLLSALESNKDLRV
ncbi:aminotransferase class V-fold PLP-dependent enzyme [Mesorhizobium sp. IMUNJ 23232]|uniref:aminotransferase class V-fold PLP-dependent enzyme n=1 Tax=Mesorhizobium sp. IMUNJ 23232 TaxID=3376064 RepID=UPI00378F4CB5